MVGAGGEVGGWVGGGNKFVYLQVFQTWCHVWVSFQIDFVDVCQRSGECQCRRVLCKEAVSLHNIPRLFLDLSLCV